jgi:hypothetical protein
MSREPSVRARQLRAELRRGDPGAGEVLAPEEAAAMRRITIAAAAASDSRAAGWLARPASSAGRAARRRRSNAGNSVRKVFAAAAAAAICVVAAVSWQERLRPRAVGDGGAPSLRRAAATRGPQPDALGHTAAGAGRVAAGQPPSASEQAARIASLAPLHPLDGRAPTRPRLEPVPPARAARAPVAAVAAGMPAPHALEGSAVAGVDTRVAAAPADPASPRAAAEPQAEPQDRSETAAAGPPAPRAANALAEVGPALPPRQVQFSLPGGTRVIWQVRGPSSR